MEEGKLYHFDLEFDENIIEFSKNLVLQILDNIGSKIHYVEFYNPLNTIEDLEELGVAGNYLGNPLGSYLEFVSNENLIAGTVKFDEADYKGTLNLPLPNNDGTCDGSYSLQEGGKGTWQISCTNDMGAAGTLKWTETGGVTGNGRDHNDKKVKFTISKKS